MVAMLLWKLSNLGTI